MELVQLIVQKKWNGRKRSETVGNGRKHDQSKTCPTRIFFKISISAQCRFFFEGPKASKGKRLETVGDARKCLFKKKCGLDKFWTDHVSDRFRPFPTVSDRFRPFHFFWTINWTNSIYGRLIQCKPVQTMTLKFFGATLVRVHCTTYCILTLISNIP